MNHSTKGSSFIQLPPDSTGKKLITGKYLELRWTAADDMPVVNDEIEGVSSGALGMVVKAEGTKDAGKAVVFIEIGSPAGDYTANESLRLFPASGAAPSIFATLGGSSIEWHVQGVRLVGANNPFTAQHVDPRGSAFIRFTEGAQQLDAMGLSRNTSPTYLIGYSFDYEGELWDLYNSGTGGGAVSYDDVQSVNNLDVDTANAAKAILGTNRYMPYAPGWSSIYSLTVACGDSGKANVRRRWGAFDERNGVFFEQLGTELRLVLRTDVTGVVVDTAVDQADWNVDEVSGQVASDSGMVLDCTMMNTYWFDIQHLGTGRIRCGVVSNEGIRTPVHEFRTINSSIAPMFSNSALPLRVEIENLGVTGSPSRINVARLFAKLDGDVGKDLVFRAHRNSFTTPAPISLSDTEKPLMSFRAGQLFEGKVNRLITEFSDYSLFLSGGPAQLRVVKNASLTGAVFGPMQPMSSPVEGDMTASAFTGGKEVAAQFFNQGAFQGVWPEGIFSYRAECMYLKHNGDLGPTYTIVGKKLNPGDTVSLLFSATWKDIGC